MARRTRDRRPRLADRGSTDVTAQRQKPHTQRLYEVNDLTSPRDYLNTSRPDLFGSGVSNLEYANPVPAPRSDIVQKESNRSDELIKKARAARQARDQRLATSRCKTKPDDTKPNGSGSRRGFVPWCK